jgi:hypothetical protein
VNSPQHDDSQKPKSGPVVLLVGHGMLGWAAINYLKLRFPNLTVIREGGEDARMVTQRRARAVGWWQARGQSWFEKSKRVIWILSRRRLGEVWAQRGLQFEPDPRVPLHDVSSVNDDDCRRLLQELNPQVVAVYSTRILSKETIEALLVPFINYHAGINPKYRGQSGGYRALRERDPENAGISIHLIDTGVDTGDIIYQAKCEFTPRDTFATYQHVQIAVALPWFARAVDDALNGRLKAAPRTDLPSRHFYYPTLWDYVWTGIRRGVW